MFCGACGKMIPEHAKFCGGCGKPVAQMADLYAGEPVSGQWQEDIYPRAGNASDQGSSNPMDNSSPSAGSEAKQEFGFMPGQWTVHPKGQRNANDDNAYPDRGQQKEAYTDNSFTDRGQREEETQFAVPSKPADMAGLPTHLANVSTADGGGSSLRRFYIIDFLVRLVGVKENLPLCIYLLLNVVIIGLITTMFTGGNILLGMFIGLGLYLISMTAALSSFGEWLLRHRVGCEPITNQAIADRINPLFQQVYARAKSQNPNLPDDIKLFMNDDDSPNAFATGRRTVCITRGLLSMSDDQIRGTLGHEFGHLAHRDTDRILVVSIGNTFITAICVFAQISAVVFEVFMHFFAIFMGEDGFFVSIMASLSRFMTIVLVGLFMRIWTWIGTALCMKTSRGNEFQADEFSCRLGYGHGLASMLQALGSSPKPEGLFAALASSHPDTGDRITRIQYFLGGGGN